MKELSGHFQGTTTKFRKDKKEKNVIPCIESVSLFVNVPAFTAGKGHILSFYPLR